MDAGLARILELIFGSFIEDLLLLILILFWDVSVVGWIFWKWFYWIYVLVSAASSWFSSN